MLSDLGVAFRKAHDLGALMDLLARSGEPLASESDTWMRSHHSGPSIRYDDYDAEVPLDRSQTRALLRALREWAEGRLRVRP